MLVAQNSLPYSSHVTNMKFMFLDATSFKAAIAELTQGAVGAMKA